MKKNGYICPEEVYPELKKPQEITDELNDFLFARRIIGPTIYCFSR